MLFTKLIFEFYFKLELKLNLNRISNLHMKILKFTFQYKVELINLII